MTDPDTKTDLLSSSPPPSYSEKKTNPSSAPPAPIPRPQPPLPLDIPILNFLRSKRVILASTSPRRKHLLSQLGLPNLEIVPPPHPETHPSTTSPLSYVLGTATTKALTTYTSLLSTQHLTTPPTPDPTVLISADTAVVLPSGEILNKPRSESAHLAMLSSLVRAGSHKVYTGVAALSPLASARDPGYALETHVEESTVYFHKDISAEVITAYVKTREGADKAGGYAVQGLGGSLLVERVEGSWDNVVGLPLRMTLAVVEKVLAKAEDEGVAMVDEFGDGEEDEERGVGSGEE